MDKALNYLSLARKARKGSQTTGAIIAGLAIAVPLVIVLVLLLTSADAAFEGLLDLLPEFVNGKYAFYTRPMDDFIETGSGGGVGFGLCDDITHAVIDEEIITSPRRYHTITESKNGEGAPPIKTDKGWLHIAHGVRNTAAGLRYVIYVFVTDLHDPWKVIAEPGGLLIGPREGERVGDVSNVVFTNGAIVDDDGSLYIYYASSDTRLHVASTTVDKLLDYAFNTPADPLRSRDCVVQRCDLIDRNLEYLKSVEE